MGVWYLSFLGAFENSTKDLAVSLNACTHFKISPIGSVSTDQVFLEASSAPL